jgi:hypothetical protein
MGNNKKTLEENIDSWKKEILDAYEGKEAVNTYKMLTDIDRILAEAFGRNPLISTMIENKEKTQNLNYERYLKSVEETPYFDATEVLKIKFDMLGMIAYAREQGKKPIELTQEEKNRFITPLTEEEKERYNALIKE